MQQPHPASCNRDQASVLLAKFSEGTHGEPDQPAKFVLKAPKLFPAGNKEETDLHLKLVGMG